MSKYRCTTAKSGKVGEVSSKYGYDKYGSQFNADIAAHIERGEQIWTKFVDFMKSNDITPQDFRTLFARYYDEFIKN